jgi:hypothetical protein
MKSLNKPSIVKFSFIHNLIGQRTEATQKQMKHNRDEINKEINVTSKKEKLLFLSSWICQMN